jgi:hypothetical protein
LFVDELRFDYGIAALRGIVASALGQNTWQSYEKHKDSAINSSHNPSVGELNRKAISVEEAIAEEADGVEYEAAYEAISGLSLCNAQPHPLTLDLGDRLGTSSDARHSITKILRRRRGEVS